MKISTVTVGLPVTSLTAASAWYEQVFELSGPDLEPIDGVIEFALGPIWLQLAENGADGAARVTVRFEVDDVDRERERLRSLGVAVPEIERIPGLIDYLDFSDPDGNLLSFYTLTGS